MGLPQSVAEESPESELCASKTGALTSTAHRSKKLVFRINPRMVNSH